MEESEPCETLNWKNKKPNDKIYSRAECYVRGKSGENSDEYPGLEELLLEYEESKRPKNILSFVNFYMS